MSASEQPGALPEDVDALFPDELRERLTALRREIHANPGLSNEEHETAQRLTAALIDVGLSAGRGGSMRAVPAHVPRGTTRT